MYLLVCPWQLSFYVIWFNFFFLPFSVLGKNPKIFRKNISRQYTGNIQTPRTPSLSLGHHGQVGHQAITLQSVSFLLRFWFISKGEVFCLFYDFLCLLVTGIQGPVIVAQAGDRVVVHFKNFASQPYSISPVGISYWKQSEGDVLLYTLNIWQQHNVLIYFVTWYSESDYFQDWMSHLHEYENSIETVWGGSLSLIICWIWKANREASHERGAMVISPTIIPS